MAERSTAPTDLVRLRRMHERGSYDAASIHAVLDASPLCTVAYVIDGRPVATPTIQWREGDHVYWHGSSASRMLKRSAGHEVCVTVSILDGFVLARSAMHHSLNYRSAMLFGTARRVDDPDAKLARLKTFVDGLFPGRWDMLRPATTQELKATTVLGMAIDEASAKVRAGQPVDDDEDYALPVWAGVLPVTTAVAEAIPDPRNLDGVTVPDNIRDFRFG